MTRGDEWITSSNEKYFYENVLFDKLHFVNLSTSRCWSYSISSNILLAEVPNIMQLFVTITVKYCCHLKILLLYVYLDYE